MSDIVDATTSAANPNSKLQEQATNETRRRPQAKAATVPGPKCDDGYANTRG